MQLSKKDCIKYGAVGKIKSIWAEGTIDISSDPVDIRNEKSAQEKGHAQNR